MSKTILVCGTCGTGNEASPAIAAEPCSERCGYIALRCNCTPDFRSRALRAANQHSARCRAKRARRAARRQEVAE